MLLKKGLLGNTISIFAIRFFPTLANLAIVILFSRQLSKTDYGTYQGFWNVLLFIGAITCAGLPAFLITYSPDILKQLALAVRRWQYIAFGIWCLSGAVIFSLLENRETVLPYWLCAAMLLLYIFHAMQEAFLFAAKRLHYVALVSFLYSVCFLLVHLFALKHQTSLTQLLLLVFAVMLLRSLLYMPVLISSLGKISVSETETTIIKKARNLWLHLGFYDLTQAVFRWVDKVIISFFLSAAVAAIYFNGTIDIPFLPVLTGAVSSATLVQLASQKNAPQQIAIDLMKRTSRLLATIIFPLFFFFLFFAAPLFELVFQGKYNDSVPVFIVGLFFLPLRVYNYTSMLQHLHKGRVLNTGAVFDLIIAFGLFYPFYKIGGLPGAALSFVLSTYLQVGYYLFHLSRILQKPFYQVVPLKDWVIKSVGFGLLMAAGCFLLKGESALTQLIAGGSLAFIMAGTAFLFEWKRLKK